MGLDKLFENTYQTDRVESTHSRQQYCSRMTMAVFILRVQNV